MPTLIIKSKITKGYDHWLKAYDSAEELRVNQYGIKTLYRGHDMEDATTVHVVMNTPSMEALQQHTATSTLSNSADGTSADSANPRQHRKQERKQ